MKKIRSKHNNLLNYFIHDRRDLSPAYVRSCEKFFRELGKKRNKFKSSSNATRHNLFTEIEKNKKNKSPSFLSQSGISYDHKAKNFKMKKQKATSSRVGPPNKVKGSKLQG